MRQLDLCDPVRGYRPAGGLLRPRRLAAALLGYVRGLERLNAQADGDLAELLEDGGHLLLDLGDEHLWRRQAVVTARSRR